MELWNIESIKHTKAWMVDKGSFLKISDLMLFFSSFTGGYIGRIGRGTEEGVQLE